MAVTASGKDKIIRYTRMYVNGYDLSGDARTFSTIEDSFAEADMTGWSESVFNFLAEQRRMTAVRGFQALANDTASSGAYSVLNSPGNTSMVLAMCFGGGGEPAVPDPAYFMAGLQVADPVGFDGASVAITADFLPDQQQLADGSNPWGYVLRGPTTLSATLAASSTTSVDFGSVVGSTTNGWHALLQVISTASGNFAFKIRDSTDDTAWADLGSFSLDGSAIATEYITGTTQVDRYVAFDATRTGGSCVVVCTFARNYI